MAKDTAPQESDGDEPDDLDAVADRLEAALERIARCLEAARPAEPPADLVARLDGLIGRLRDILGGPEGPARD